jgi:hypothetical protein
MWKLYASLFRVDPQGNLFITLRPVSECEGAPVCMYYISVLWSSPIDRRCGKQEQRRLGRVCGKPDSFHGRMSVSRVLV